MCSLVSAKVESYQDRLTIPRTLRKPASVSIFTDRYNLWHRVIKLKSMITRAIILDAKKPMYHDTQCHNTKWHRNPVTERLVKNMTNCSTLKHADFNYYGFSCDNNCEIEYRLRKSATAKFARKFVD